MKEFMTIMFFGLLTYITASFLMLARAHADGTGVFINNKGYILTNHHVVEDKLAAYYVVVHGIKYPAILYKDGFPLDLAVIHINYNSPCLQVAESGEFRGEKLGVLQFNLLDGKYQNFDVKKSYFDTEVYRTGYLVTTEDRGSAEQVAYSLTNDFIRPGNSGSPLLNSHGQIQGIAFAGNAASTEAYVLSYSTLNEMTHKTDAFNCPNPSIYNISSLEDTLVWIYQS